MLALRLLTPLLALWLCAWPTPSNAEERVIFETESLYHYIYVTDADDGLRYLAFNRAMGYQSAVKPGHPEVLSFAYTRSAFAALAFLENDPADVLFVGLGAGSMQTFLRRLHPHARVDIVEIDPEVTRVAQRLFEFRPDPAMRVHEADGRAFLRRNAKKYDLIFLDAYNDFTVPFHLTTREFLELVRDRLKPGGVVASNIWSARINRFFTAQVKTYQAVFGELYLLRAQISANYIFIATPGRGPISAEQAVGRAAAVMAGRDFGFDLAELVRREYDRWSERQVDARLLTDDFAPVNLLRLQDLRGGELERP